jgi:4-hydroxy-4-methyl-2-oxoglutarate aldolase
MFEINAMPPQIAADLLELLSQCRSESIGHHREWGSVHGSIAAVMPERRVVGTAITVACAGNDSGIVAYAVSSLRPGDVLLIDRLGDSHNACWGGGTTLAAKLAGAAGVVIDGPSTGSSRFRDFDLPAWVRGYSPITCHPQGNGGAINVPVCVGGAAVLPGYAVLADESGVIVLPPADVRYLAEAAIGRQDGYPAVHARLRAGEKMTDMSGLGARIAAAAAAEDAARGRSGRG